MLTFLKKLDWVLIAIVAVIILLGAVTFYGVNDRSLQTLERQVIFLFLGLGMMGLIGFFDYRILKNYTIVSLLLYALMLILLIIVFASQQIRGIRAWIIFFNTYQFQPSEFAKLVVLIVLAKYFSEKHSKIHLVHHILGSGIYVLVPAFLVFMQPDFGSMAIFVVLWLAMLFFAGIQRRHLFVIIMSVLILGCFAWFFVFKPYQKDRIVAFLNPYVDARGIGYNTIQAQTATGAGRWLGIWQQSKDKPMTIAVPEPFTDFAFAVYAQKFGFVGLLALFALFGALFYRLGAIALRAKNNFAKLFILGYIVLVVSHIMVNAGMNLGLLPITGIPLSFLSYGGSHLITLMIGLGIVQSIKIYS